MTELAERSITYWNDHQVAVFPDDVTAADSFRVLNARNSMYPGLLGLMPVRGFEGKTIIDFGCGPGHDTIMFLMNGAKRVYAVDASANGLASVEARLRAHGLTERCTTVLMRPGLRLNYKVDHIHTAGVIHHLEKPVVTLSMLRDCLKPKAEIRMMVYAAESEYVANCGGPTAFEVIADGDAPIAKAWTREQVRELARRAGLKATYLGGYLMAETSGPGLGGCWSLKP